MIIDKFYHHLLIFLIDKPESKKEKKYGVTHISSLFSFRNRIKPLISNAHRYQEQLLELSFLFLIF